MDAPYDGDDCAIIRGVFRTLILGGVHDEGYDDWF